MVDSLKNYGNGNSFRKACIPKAASALINAKMIFPKAIRGPVSLVISNLANDRAIIS